MTETEINQAQRQGLSRLNSRQPQYPADSYFIKSDRAMLEKYVQSPAMSRELQMRATPKQYERFNIFGNLGHDDLRALSMKGVVFRGPLSGKDPFLTKMSISPRKNSPYPQLYRNV